MQKTAIHGLMLAMLSGCAVLAPPSDDVPAAAVAGHAAKAKKDAAAESHVDKAATVADMVEYYQRVRGLGAGEWQREYNHVLRQLSRGRNEVLLLQQAMLLAVARNSAEQGRALGLLEGIQKSGNPDSVPLKPLAGMLYGLIMEQRRLEDQQDKCVVHLRDEQKRAATLADKLEGMKEIDRSLANRPLSGGKPAL